MSNRKAVVEVNASAYERSHGKSPRGFGSWAFVILGEIVWIPGAMTYGDARRVAVAIAREKMDADETYLEVEVCS